MKNRSKFKWAISLLLFPFIHSSSQVADPTLQKRISLNDTNYTRIVDGIIVDKDFKAPPHWSEVAALSDKQSISKWGIQSSKPLLLITTQKYPVEYDIISELMERTEFFNAYMEFPASAMFPISINGKLLNSSDRETILPTLTLNQVKAMKYLTNSESNLKYAGTPFGVIELTI